MREDADDWLEEAIAAEELNPSWANVIRNLQAEVQLFREQLKWVPCSELPEEEGWYLYLVPDVEWSDEEEYEVVWFEPGRPSGVNVPTGATMYQRVNGPIPPTPTEGE